MSLDLDERQRAMLEEMHVRVWWPEAAEPEALPVTAQVVSSAPPPVARPAVAVMQAQPAAPAGLAPGGAIDELQSMDWPALAGTIGACTACGLCTGRKAPVFQPEAGARQADWLVVGEPPDEQEERAGSAFAGQSGQLMDNMLRALGLARNGSGGTGARLSNVVKCRTVPVRNPQPDELARCAVYLRREIALVQPKVILAMGRFAALSLLGESAPELAALPFGKLRGKVHLYHGVPLVVTYHPGRLLRAQEDKAGAWADLCLAQSVVRGGPPGGGA